jgi:hypothetical protein
MTGNIEIGFAYGPKMAYFWAMTILKSSQLKSSTGRVLDRAIRKPQYIERNGILLVITKANLKPAGEETLTSPWEIRAKNLESFYDPAKAW